MTHVEFLEKRIEEYQKGFNTTPTDDEKVIAFREGMLYALKTIVAELKGEY